MGKSFDTFYLPVVILVRFYVLGYSHRGVSATEDCSACVASYYSPQIFGAPAILSNETIPLNAPPLVFNVDLNKLRYRFCNNGETVTLTPLGNTTFTLTGGTLCGETYIFYVVVFSWAPSYSQSCSWTIDRYGNAVDAITYFYNSKYASPEEAAGKQNGILSVDVQILVTGLISQDKFDTFEEKSQHILDYNTCVDVDSAFSISQWWLSSINTSVPYYTFATGIFESAINRNVTAYTVGISFANGPWISIKNFRNTFARYKNKNNQTYAAYLNATVNPKKAGFKVYESLGYYNVPN